MYQHRYQPPPNHLANKNASHAYANSNSNANSSYNNNNNYSHNHVSGNNNSHQIANNTKYSLHYPVSSATNNNGSIQLKNSAHLISYTGLPKSFIDERQDVIFRRVRGILNKITPETFDKLSRELVNVGLDSPRTLRGVIYLLFDKALKDLKYSSLYAKLCQELSEKAPNFEQEPGPNTFCKFLISKCEDEFERRRKATEDFDNKNELTEEEYEQRTIAKQKMLGNIKFICELGKKRLLQEEILHECIRGLLSKKRERPIQDQAQDLECLCQIMRTIGSLLDVQASRNLMNQYFDRIDMFSKKPELPPRIKFMLRDVIDLRNNKWRPRPFQREDNVPQPISKLREEAGLESSGGLGLDKLGKGLDALKLGDLSKLNSNKLNSLLLLDEPSFTTSTDFHWGPSFSALEDPFEAFSNPKYNSPSTQQTKNNTASTTTTTAQPLQHQSLGAKYGHNQQSESVIDRPSSKPAPRLGSRLGGDHRMDMQTKSSGPANARQNDHIRKHFDDRRPETNYIDSMSSRYDEMAPNMSRFDRHVQPSSATGRRQQTSYSIHHQQGPMSASQTPRDFDRRDRPMSRRYNEPYMAPMHPHKPMMQPAFSNNREGRSPPPRTGDSTRPSVPMARKPVPPTHADPMAFERDFVGVSQQQQRHQQKSRPMLEPLGINRGFASGEAVRDNSEDKFSMSRRSPEQQQPLHQAVFAQTHPHSMQTRTRPQPMDRDFIQSHENATKVTNVSVRRMRHREGFAHGDQLPSAIVQPPAASVLPESDADHNWRARSSNPNLIQPTHNYRPVPVEVNKVQNVQQNMSNKHNHINHIQEQQEPHNPQRIFEDTRKDDYSERDTNGNMNFTQIHLTSSGRPDVNVENKSNATPKVINYTNNTTTTTNESNRKFENSYPERRLASANQVAPFPHIVNQQHQHHNDPHERADFKQNLISHQHKLPAEVGVSLKPAQQQSVISKKPIGGPTTDNELIRSPARMTMRNHSPVRQSPSARTYRQAPEVREHVPGQKSQAQSLQVNSRQGATHRSSNREQDGRTRTLENERGKSASGNDKFERYPKREPGNSALAANYQPPRSGYRGGSSAKFSSQSNDNAGRGNNWPKGGRGKEPAPSITANIIPKAPTSVIDENFSLRPSHNLVGRLTGNKTSTTSMPSADDAAQSAPQTERPITSNESPRSVDGKEVVKGEQETASNNKTASPNTRSTPFDFPPKSSTISKDNQNERTNRDEKSQHQQSQAHQQTPQKQAARTGDAKVEGSEKFTALLDQPNILSPDNMAKTVLKIRDLKVPKSAQCACLVHAMKQSLLKSEVDRDNVCKLFVSLVPATFDQSALSSAFVAIFEQLKALEAETPKVKSLVAGFLGRAVADNLISLEEVGGFLTGGKHHPLFLLFLQKLERCSGQAWLVEKFAASKLDLMNMLPEVDRSRSRLASILKDRALGFLDPMLTVEPDLWCQMKERDASPNAVYRWIKDNVDQVVQTSPMFAHVLMTCLLKYIVSTASDKANTQQASAAADDGKADSSKSTPSSASVSVQNDTEKDLLGKYQQILQALLSTKQLQLATLYSLQSFYYEQDFPKGALLRWFHMLYDMNIVDDDVFFVWKEEINDDFQGKGQALFQVNAWLNWLAEEDSEEEES